VNLFLSNKDGIHLCGNERYLARGPIANDTTTLRRQLLPPRELAAFAWLCRPDGFDGARQLHRIKSELFPHLVRRLKDLIKLLVLRRVNQAALKHAAFQI
jgi:hypothetical protein